MLPIYFSEQVCLFFSLHAELPLGVVDLVPAGLARLLLALQKVIYSVTESETTWLL